ncbi:putative mitochondrial inheritance component mdm12 [Triangularia verruculosa]|uniref:Mitochondrial distribution and morphology protein 12 n=1 Tax=Triangularia verruculosa TaxID=2587418 RepID=A0AAN6X984_9PEZI|nr:putative mitochondrial inheritance component mdm12 [Triangularia verruculosa]
MSIDLNWETVTGGPDGQELADSIRDFIHTKFQSVPLPRFIKSVTVHDFQFGTIPPEIELKDITDPLPDFYEENLDSDLASESGSDEDEEEIADDRKRRQTEDPITGGAGTRNPSALPPHLSLGGLGGLGGLGAGGSRNGGDIGSPFLRVNTPGIPGGTSNLHYFHSQFATGLSGTQTPLAAVAGAHRGGASWLEGHGHSSSAPNLHQYGAPDFGGVDGQASNGPANNQGFRRPLQQQQQPSSHRRNPSQSSISVADASPSLGLTPPSPTTLLVPPFRSPSSAGGPSPPPGLAHQPHPHHHHAHHQHPLLREKHSVSTLAASAGPPSRPPTRDKTTANPDPEDVHASSTKQRSTSPATSSPLATSAQEQAQEEEEEEEKRKLREKKVDDMQAVFRIRYAGDIKLLLTADILLDYPMPSFVGIPVRLSITGLTFDGVGVLAKIRKRVHFCFLSPEDAVAAVGQGENEVDGDKQTPMPSANGLGATKLGGLLQEIRVESEIGQRESGKQSLKNVGKVERFVLEQVRRIFEEEFVYPSYWTFLV